MVVSNYLGIFSFYCDVYYDIHGFILFLLNKQVTANKQRQNDDQRLDRVERGDKPTILKKKR